MSSFQNLGRSYGLNILPLKKKGKGRARARDSGVESQQAMARVEYASGGSRWRRYLVLARLISGATTYGPYSSAACFVNGPACSVSDESIDRGNWTGADEPRRVHALDT